ncbi:MAG: ATP-binding protein [Spirochaetaceae bacterium]|nr:ATP-binding protein [Spirochaetaceae bacterium]
MRKPRSRLGGLPSGLALWLFARGGMKRSLLVPFVLLLVAGFGASWLIYVRASRDAVLSAVDALVEESTRRGVLRVESYLEDTLRLAEANAAFIRSSPDASSRLPELRRALRLQLLARPEIDILSVGFADGEYAEAQRLEDGRIRTGSAGRGTGRELVLERTDGRGNPVAVELRRPGYDPRERPWYRQAAAKGGPGWTDPYPIASSGELTMAASVPITEDRQTLGVVTADLRLGRISDFLADIDVSRGGLAFIVDRAGFVVAGSSSVSGSRPGEAGRERPRPAELGSAAAAIYEAGRAAPNTLVSVAAAGGPYRAILLPLGGALGLDWRLALAYPESSFLEPLAKIDLRVWLILLVMLGASIILAFATANRVAVPLKRLGTALSSFAPGGSRGFAEATQAVASRNDEIGRLARSSAALAERLDASFAALEASLAEKEILLKEVHHRVKNNLQIVSSLVRFQADRLAGGAGEDGFEELQERIQAMAFVHEDVYLTGNFEAVEMGRYLGRVAGALCAERGDGARADRACRVELAVEAEGVSLGLDRALPCGLIVNELVANSLKHAFPSGSSGTIGVSLRLGDGGYELVVADDGRGLSLPLAAPGGTPRRLDGSEGLGSSLVQGLVRQLGGTLAYESAPVGTSVRIRFPR